MDRQTAEWNDGPTKIQILILHLAKEGKTKIGTLPLEGALPYTISLRTLFCRICHNMVLKIQ